MAGSQRQVAYGLKFCARALESLDHSLEKPQWIVATAALKEPNEIHILEYDEETESLNSKAQYAYPFGEVQDVAPSPSHRKLCATIHSKEGASTGALWHLPIDGSELEQKDAFAPQEGCFRKACWHPKDPEKLLVVSGGGMQVYNVQEGKLQKKQSASPGGLTELWTGIWSPMELSTAVVAAGNDIQIWDLRDKHYAGAIEGAHTMPVRALDFPQQSPHLLGSAGDDCYARFWDVRVLRKNDPLLEIHEHYHQVWTLKFNPRHPQLLLLGSSDASVTLHNVPALFPQQQQSTSTSPKTDRAENFQKLESHEDSVYKVAWTAADPWVFASLSYDGRVIIDKVPNDIKYQILI